jgi:hypothetical protein
MRRTLPIVCLLGTLAIAMTLYFAVRPPLLRLDVKLLASPQSQADTIETASTEPVTCRWELCNSGRVGLSKLRFVVGCSCQWKEQPPSSIASGQTAVVALRLVPPSAGTARREIPVFANDQATPIAVLSANLRTKVSPPQWLTPPKSIELTGVAASEFRREFVWDAVEERGTRPWIQQATLDSTENVGVELSHVESAWGEDGRYCLRKYRVAFRAIKPKTGTYRGLLHLHSVTESVQKFAWTVEVLPALSVIPNEVVLSYGATGKQTAAVTVVRRSSNDVNGGTLNVQSDANVLELRPVSAEGQWPRRFEVAIKDGLKSPFESPVVFEADGLESAVLNVRFASESP